MANTPVIQMLGNSACFSPPSEDSVIQPMVQLSWWGWRWDHEPRETGAGTASAALLSQQQLKNSFGKSIINPLLLLGSAKGVDLWV